MQGAFKSSFKMSLLRLTSVLIIEGVLGRKQQKSSFKNLSSLMDNVSTVQLRVGSELPGHGW